MFLVLKLLVFYIWCCDGMRLGVQVMSACLVDVSVAGRVAIENNWSHLTQKRRQGFTQLHGASKDLKFQRYQTH